MFKKKSQLVKAGLTPLEKMFDKCFKQCRGFKNGNLWLKLRQSFLTGLTVLISVFTIYGVAQAIPPTSLYNPGETLNPACAPGDTNCTIVAPAVSTRLLNTTSPLAGGGDLSTNRTLTIGGLSSLGTANYLLGVNPGATGWEYKQLLGTTNRITVDHAAGSLTLSTPQDIATTSSPTFTGLTLSGLIPDGVVRAASGILSSEAQLALGRGGTGANLSATGGANQFAKQTTLGGAFTVGVILDAELPSVLTGKTYDGLSISTGTDTFTLTRGLSTLTRSGGHSLTLTTTGTTTATFPSGTITLADLDSTQTFTGAKTFSTTPLTLSADSAILSFSNTIGTKQITTGGITPLALMPGGNVGIGTTSPGAKLEVAGQVKITGGTPGAGKVLTSDVAGLATWETAAGGGLPSGTSGQTLRHDGTNWVANSVIFNNGTNVGIGTTAPGRPLVVAGPSGDMIPIIDVQATASTPWGRGIRTLASGMAAGNDLLFHIGQSESIRNSAYFGYRYMGDGSTSSYFGIGHWGVDYILNVTAAGNVGIGTTAPSHLLHIAGAIRQGSALNCALSVDASGVIICTPSSLQYKEVLKDWSFDREKFLSIPTRSFRWQEEKLTNLGISLDGESLGFIAEEVDQMMPDLARYNSEGQPIGIKTDLLPFYLFETIKSQQKEIYELKLAINQNGNLTQNDQELTNSQSVNSLTETIKQVLASLGLAIENGIAKVKELFADRITTKQICIEGDDSETICLDKSQLKELLMKNQIQNQLNPTPEPESTTPDVADTTQ
jgi:hypothetical protein